MSIDLHGKVAIVTGGARGIGQEISMILAKHGANVAIVNKSMEDLEKTVKEVEKHGVKTIGLIADATKKIKLKTQSKK
ncbi:MAG: SDR family NAD(P)-dependent oxidoreductase [Desulfurococcaceae archaeon]